MWPDRPALDQFLRRYASVSSLLTLISLPFSFASFIAGHVWRCIVLAVKLFIAVSKGTKAWFVMFLRLIIFSMILLPGWYRMLRYWCFSPYVIRNVDYGGGSKQRNLLDIYLPPWHSEKKFPVVVFLSGGAWIIGYKLWSGLLGKGLSRLGIITVAPDYRNYPQGTIEDMISDVRMALQWTQNNIKEFGGDSENITLAGQSAGAHIALCALISEFEFGMQRMRAVPLRQLEAFSQASATATVEVISCEAEHSSEDVKQKRRKSREFCVKSGPLGLLGGQCQCPYCSQSASPVGPSQVCLNAEACAIRNEEKRESNQRHMVTLPSQLQLTPVKLYIGISGPYNLVSLLSHMHRRGLDSSIIRYIFGDNLAKYSPSLQLSEIASQFNGMKLEKQKEMHRYGVGELPLRFFPSVALFHGTRDCSVPVEVAEELSAVLEQGGCSRVTTAFFENWSHTDPIIEGPFSGRGDLFWRIRKAIEESCGDCNCFDEICSPEDANDPEILVHPRLVNLARAINPF